MPKPNEQRVVSPTRRTATQPAAQARAMQKQPAPPMYDEAYDEPEPETEDVPAAPLSTAAVQYEQQQRIRERDNLLNAVRQAEQQRAARTTRAGIPRQSHPDYAITDETATYDTRSTNSAVRYEQPQRTAQARARNTTAQQPIRRASTTGQNRQTAALAAAKYRRRLRLSRSLVAIGILALIIIFMVMGAAVAPVIGGTVQGISNRITYGDPPTSRYDVFTGHYGRDTSHIEAINRGGKIYVSEQGNGTVLNPKLYYIITLTGDGAGSYPVTLTFADITHDGKTDILVNVKGFQLPMYNTGTGFSTTHP